MKICECANPTPRQSTTAPGQQVCITCGQWWMPQHGSRRPGDTRPTRQQLEEQRARPSAAAVAKLKQVMERLKK